MKHQKKLEDIVTSSMVTDTENLTSIQEASFTCLGCGVRKKMSEFHRSKKRKYGIVRTECKVCHNKKASMYEKKINTCEELSIRYRAMRITCSIIERNE